MKIRREIRLELLEEFSFGGKIIGPGVVYENGAYLLDSTTDPDGNYLFVVETPIGRINFFNSDFCEITFLDVYKTSSGDD